MEIIDGKAIAQKIRKEIKDEIEKISDRHPSLAIILVGSRDDSELYVKLKEKAAREVGIETHLYKFSENSRQEEVIETIRHLNSDEEVDAILVQLPLPDGFNTDKIMSILNPKKDVDGFQAENLKVLMNTCQNEKVIPPVFRVVLRFLEETGSDLRGKKAIVISNSDVFGKSLEKVLQCKGVLAKKIDSDNDALEEEILTADVVISAVGKPGFIKGNVLKDDIILIDVGITKKGKKVYGDADAGSMKHKKGFLTPVPGGVGPMTVAMLLKNTLELYERRGIES